MVVSIVAIKQLKKTTFKDMYNLSMRELFIVVSIATTKQLENTMFKYMCNFFMVVSIVTIKQPEL